MHLPPVTFQSSSMTSWGLMFSGSFLNARQCLPRQPSIMLHQSACAELSFCTPSSSAASRSCLRTISQDPTIGMSALTVLAIEVGSTSIWIILAFGQNFATLFVMRSANLVPTARMTSELCMVMLAS